MKFAAFALLLMLLPYTALAAPLPDNSIYHIESPWLDQDATPLMIGDLRGKVQVMAFIYTYCEHSCPVILSRLQRLESSLSAAQLTDVNFLLVSLDPQRDTPAVLQRYALDKSLDTQHWRLLNGAADDVLALSALVGVRYQPMDMEGKDIAHSNMITVLDPFGRVFYQMQGLAADPELVLQAIVMAMQVTR